MGKIVGLTFDSPKNTAPAYSSSKTDAVTHSKNDTEKTSSKTTEKNTDGGDK